jgi:hypothetical protein
MSPTIEPHSNLFRKRLGDKASAGLRGNHSHNDWGRVKEGICEERIGIQEDRIEDYESNRPLAVRPSIHSG